MALCTFAAPWTDGAMTEDKDNLSSRRDRKDVVTIPKSSEVRLKMIRLPGESEPTPQVFTCPTCGDNARLVMVRVGPRAVKSAGPPKRGDEGGQFLLQITRRQAEQLLEEFQKPL
jgi:hypothetical protein